MDTINAVPNFSNPTGTSTPIHPESSDYHTEVSHKVQEPLTFPSHISVAVTSATASTTSDAHKYIPESLNKKQVRLASPCELITGSKKTTTEFKKDGRLIVYPTNPAEGRGHGTNILIYPADLLIDMYDEMTTFWDYELNESDLKIWANSILQRLPPDFKEFLYRDWSAKEQWLLTPEEYQPLARLHWAVAGFKKYESSKKDLENERNKERVIFFEEVSLPLRDGWSKKEIEFIEDWLGSLLIFNHEDYSFNNFGEYMDFCLKGTLDTGCISFCDTCETRMTENREAYERIKSLEQQLASFGLKSLPTIAGQITTETRQDGRDQKITQNETAAFPSDGSRIDRDNGFSRCVSL